MEKTPVVVAAEVVVVVAVGNVTTELITMKVVLEAVEATRILAITIINLQILNPQREKTLEAEALAPTMMAPIFSQTRKLRSLWCSSSSSNYGSSRRLITTRKKSLAGEESQK